MQMRKRSHDDEQKKLDDLQLQGDERKDKMIAMGMESYMKPMAVAPVCGWDAVDYPRSKEDGQMSVVFHNRNAMYLKGDLYFVLNDLDKGKNTEDTIDVDAFGSASIQYAEGADKKVYELWGDIAITPELLRDWVKQSVIGLAKWNQMKDGELKYLNPYHIPRYSTKWEVFNAIATRKPEFMIPVE